MHKGKGGGDRQRLQGPSGPRHTFSMPRWPAVALFFCVMAIWETVGGRQPKGKVRCESIRALCGGWAKRLHR